MCIMQPEATLSIGKEACLGHCSGQVQKQPAELIQGGDRPAWLVAQVEWSARRPQACSHVHM